MLESLFGAETPLAVRFFIAFIVVFALIGLVAWLIRRFGTGALGASGARGRAPRLAVIEAGAVDGRRKLVLIRRDNVEHLLMIGGPADIVVEQNIVRGQNSGRDVAPARGTAEALQRPAPIAEETSWPLQPDVAPRPPRPSRPAPTPMPAPVEDNLHWPLPAEPKAPTVAPKRQRSDTLAGLAAELSVRPAAPQPEADLAPVRPAPKIEHKIEPKIEQKIEHKIEPRIEPKISAPKIDLPAPQPAAVASETDQNLADMAQRLEAALRRPAAPAPAQPAALKPAAEKPATGGKPATLDKPAAAPKPKTDNVFGSLEEEMASLLGRPPGKT
jgi:hypothetical protein